MKELLKKLIEAKSTPDVGEADCANVLAEFFTSAGIKADVEIWDTNRANITARLKSTGQKPALIFLSHLDVVPASKRGWSSDAFEATEKDGKIFGRGSCDMKGGITAAAVAMTEIAKSDAELKGDLIFAATAGEETDSIGVKKLLESFDSALCGAIVTEPTDFDLITAHRGLLWLEIITKGKTAHGSMPHLGINAIESMRAFLNELENYNISADTNELLGKASMSVNKIKGGSATNVVPDSCRAQIDIRTLPQQNHSDIIEDIKNIFSRLEKQVPDFQAELKVIRDVSAMQTDSKCEFINSLKSILERDEIKAAPFTTDGPFLAELNIPVVIFGPGKGQLCHKPDEYIDIEDLQKGINLYKQIILHFLT
ncbi:MAG: M20 family metallopeptidase [Sedimentisphaerales bacterium]|nr:M20 family metallopeptidase [Sedimentisphaerales bacterium]